MAIPFKPSPRHSIGIEWELQLVDGNNWDLIDGILPLLELFPGSQRIKPEFIQNTVEIVSDPCPDIVALEENVAETLSELQQACAELNFELCASGTHPFNTDLALLTPLPKYKNIERDMGLMAHTQVTFGHHVHIGMESGDQAIAVMNHLLAYLPVLIALSANSPFWRGFDTGHCAYRHRIVSASRSYGIPPSFDNWDDFSRIFEDLLEAKVYQNINGIHWDLRPRPHLGTLEIRLMDALPTLEETIDLSALVYTLVVDIIERVKANREGALLPLPHVWIQKENHYQAARLGLEAPFLEPELSSPRLLREVVYSILRSLRSTATACHTREHLARIESQVSLDALAYQRQRYFYETRQSFPEVIRSLVNELGTSKMTASKTESTT